MPLQSRRRFLCQSAALAVAACGSPAFSSHGSETRVATQAGWNGGRTPADTTIASVVGAGTIGRLREVVCWTQPAMRGAATVSGENLFRMRGGHLLSGPFSALKLAAPATIYGAGSAAPGAAFPKSMAIRYEFADHGDYPGLVLTWYDGDWAPPYESVDGYPLSASGALYLGESGQILDDGISGRRVLLRDDEPPHDLPSAVLPSLRAGPVEAHVDASVVAGIVSYRVQRSLEWDGVAMCARNCPAADTLFRQM